MKDLPIRFIRWERTHRIIPVRRDDQRVFDLLGKPGDFDPLDALDQSTREPRAKPRDHANETFRYQSKSRFSDGTFGVYYAARRLTTALKESIYHRELFLGDTQQPPLRVYARLLLATVTGRFHDLRKKQATHADLYSPRRGDYAASQKYGVQLKEEGAKGLCYDSVRDPGGTCVAVFERSCVSHCREERWFEYRWDGRRVADVYELRSFFE